MGRGWTIYNSKGVPLVTSKAHDHTAADGSGPLTDDEHDGYSEHDEISAPGAGAANKGRLYCVDRGGITTLQWVDPSGVLAEVTHPPTAHVFHSTTQTIASASFTNMSMDSEDFDTDTMHDTSTNTNRLTATTAGKYLVYGKLQFAAHATGTRIIGIQVNGAGTIYRLGEATPSGSIGSLLHGSIQFVLAAGDYVSLIGYQSSGGDLALGNASRVAANEFGMFWVAP